MRVQIVYATLIKQRVVELDVPEGTTIYQAVVLSGIVTEFPEIDLGSIPMGVFGVVTKMATTTLVRPDDRVELYRSLIMDPKESRRTRAESQKHDRS